MRPTKRGWRWPDRRTLALIFLGIIIVALYCVLVPIHTTVYGTDILLALMLGAGLCGAPALSITHPRLAITAFLISAVSLWLLGYWPRSSSHLWPWSIPAMLAFIIFVFVITLVHGWKVGLVPWLAGNIGALITNSIMFWAVGITLQGEATGILIVTTALTSVAILIAVLLSARIQVSAQLSRAQQISASEQSRRMLVEERTRIARELHDVIAHSMSLIQVQSSTARYRLPGLPTEVAAEFEEIAAVARRSLTEMRRLLGVLRTEEHEQQLIPQQGIADIPELVDSVQRAGAEVRLSLSEPATQLSPSLGITAFRIVQEGLSNAVRHAPGAAIDVVVTSLSSALSIQVHNERGADPSPATATGSGHGLRGMQERILLVKGSLIVGPDPNGGWTLTAVLPWDEPMGEHL